MSDSSTASKVFIPIFVAAVGAVITWYLTRDNNKFETRNAKIAEFRKEAKALQREVIDLTHEMSTIHWNVYFSAKKINEGKFTLNDYDMALKRLESFKKTYSDKSIIYPDQICEKFGNESRNTFKSALKHFNNNAINIPLMHNSIKSERELFNKEASTFLQELRNQEKSVETLKRQMEKIIQEDEMLEKSEAEECHTKGEEQE